ncbi:MAG TPA: hypothetical protein VNO26_14245 [Candidatus Limnocylindria bacterium]|nr:hypothetical protein [Candidatus Limnocylindria bacterium]
MRRTIPAAVAITVLSLADDSHAGDPAALLLPLSDTLALIERQASAERSAGDAPGVLPSRRGPAPGAPPPPPAFIPKRIHVPDLYRVDYERDAPRFAEPVDNDRMVALEFLPPAGRRPGVAFTYDTESLPIGDSSDRVSIRVELPF